MSITFSSYFGPVTGTASLPFYRPIIAASRTGENVASLPFYRPTIAARLPYPSVELPFYRPALHTARAGENAGAITFYRPIIEAYSFPAPVSRVAVLPFYRPAVEAVGIVHLHGAAEFTFYRPQLHVARTGEVAAAVPFYRPLVEAQQDDPGAGMFFATQSPGFVSVLAGAEIVALHSTLNMGAQQDHRTIYGLVDILGIGDTQATVRQVLEHLRSDMDMTDALDIVYRLLLSSGLVLGDTSIGSLLTTLEVIDVLRLHAGAGATTQTFHAVASALALHDVLARRYKEVIADQLLFNAEVAHATTRQLALLDGVALGDTPAHSATFHAIVKDDLALGDSLAFAREVLMRVASPLGLTCTITLGDTVYYAWVVNTASKGFSQYENYPFNSFAPFPGGPEGQKRYFGMAADGIYELEGPDDAGNDIDWRMRLGLSNMGTAKMKRFPSLYLGYASDGQMLLRVTITSPGGEKVEYHYKLQPRAAGEVREGRIKIGRGLKSVYWDFELSSVDGASIDLNKFDLLPMILDRRIGGG